MKVLALWGVGTGSAADVLDDDGVRRTVQLPGILAPTDDQIVAAVAPQSGRTLIGSTRGALRADRDAKYVEWRMARDSRAEVIARAVPAEQAWATSGAGLAWENAAWAAYRAAVLAWAAAP